MSGLDLAGSRVCVAGLGLSGASAARALTALGADVVTADRRDGTDRSLPAGVDLVVTSPGWRPTQPLLVAAADAGVPVWGDVELAWQLRPSHQEWLGVTGTNGKTTSVRMLESMLLAAGRRAVACGNVGLPVLDAVLDSQPYDVLAVELSSFQLHWTHTVAFSAAAVLNIAPDHLDWHGSMSAYAADKAAIWRSSPVAVYNADDAGVSSLVAGLVAGLVSGLVAEPPAGRVRSVGFTLGDPAAGQLGVRGGTLLDRTCGAASNVASSATGPEWETPAPAGGGGGRDGVGSDSASRAEDGGGDRPDLVLADVADVRPTAPHNVANALAAASLARAVGVQPSAVREGLRTFSPGPHRITHVATVDGVDYVDDSKATNPHAAAASLAAFDRVVWVAGGLAKGARFEGVVLSAAGRLRAAVLLGRDRDLVGEALARHAPEVPVVDVGRTDTGAMDDVVRAAAGLAEPGDTVLLAPACASMDMFRDYAARGHAFADAVRRLGS